MPTLPRDVPIVLYIDEHLEFGGLAIYAFELAGGLRRKGYRVVAICHENETVRPMREILVERGVEVRVMKGFELGLAGRLKRIWTLQQMLREYAGCVLALLMGYPNSGTIITIAGTLARVRAIIRFDAQPPLSVRLRDIIMTQLKFRMVDQVTVGAVEHLELYTRGMKLSSKKIRVIHTGIDVPRFQADVRRASVRDSLGYAPDALVVGTMSRLTEQRKGVNYFLDLAARVAPGFPNARFLIIGDGWLRPQLEKYAAELGIRDRCTFTGWSDDRHGLLASMDVFVMPSLKEGGPTTVLEAMASGLPVIATRVGMVPEVVEDGRTGFIVPLADADALAERLRPLLADEALRARIGQRAREKAQASFSIDHMTERYLDLFANAIAR
jgi:glycosyltransferase involved in cell wall biosynthesis